MLKRSLLFGMTALLAVSFIFLGCKGGDAGANGSNGPAGTSYLSGSQSTEVIQYAIDAGGPLVLAGVTQLDTKTLIIPAGRGVKILGTFTTAATGSVLVIADASSVNLTDGNIVAGSSNPVIIAPQAILTEKVSGTTNVIPIQTGAEAIDLSETTVAVKGNITISTDATSSTNIKNDTAGKTLYIIGNLTVNGPISTTAINVLGNVTQAAAALITSTVNVSGDFTSAVTGGTAAVTGALSVDGNASFTGEAAKIEALTVGGNLTAGVLAADNGGVVVKGTTSITSLTPHASSGSFTFSKTATIGTLVSTGVTALTIAGVGDVTITTPGTFGTAAALTKTGTGKLTLTDAVTVGTTSLEIAGTGPVVLAAAPVITNHLVITNTAGVNIPSFIGVSNQTINAIEGKVTFGTATDYITVTKGIITCEAGVATIYDATNKLLNLATSASLRLAEGTGALVIGGAAKIVANKTTIGGASSWDVSASGGNAGSAANPGGLTITSSANGASIALTAGSATRTAAVLVAGGTAPTITQSIGASNALTVGDGITINLAGSATEAVGKIVLVSGTDPGKLVLSGTTGSKILLGAGTGGSNIGGVTTITIGGKTIVNTDLTVTDYKVDSTKLVIIGGATAGNITASTSSGNDVVIDPTQVASGS
jgi:hypothetical protein